MKKILLVSVVALSLAKTASADASYLKRKNCLGIFGYKYKSYADVERITNVAYFWADGAGTSKNCSGTSVRKTGYFLATPGGTGTVYATAEALSGSSLGSASTYIQSGFTSKFTAGGNVDNDLAEFSYAPMYENLNTQTAQSMEGTFSKITTTDISFNELNHSVVISGINAKIGVDDPDMANSYSTFKIFILDARNVTNESDAKVIQTLQAFVINGILTLQGDLKQSDFIKTEGKSIFTSIELNKTILIDPSISLDDVIVKIGSDAGNLGQGVNPSYRMNFHEKEHENTINSITEASSFKLNLMENPVSNNLKFIVADKKDNNTIADINIINTSGNTIMKVYNGEINNIDKTVSVDISSLSNGVYYIVVVTNNNEKYTRKFIKQ